MNKAYFFDRIRRAVFGGRLTHKQVDGMSRILAYRDEKWPKMPDAELAYLLATTVHETAFTMQPIREMGSAAYFRTKRYAPKWIGRGLIQITWKYNYEKFGIANDPDSALKWPTALDIAFRGMIFGMFTGKKLSDYIKPNKVPDFVGARRIINGTDRANLIAGYARSFLDALTQSKETPK
jgi:hypothetical protein